MAFKDITPDISINHPYPNVPEVDCMLDYYSEKKIIIIHSFHHSYYGKESWVICEKVFSPFKELINNYGIELKSNKYNTINYQPVIFSKFMNDRLISFMRKKNFSSCLCYDLAYHLCFFVKDIQKS